MAKLTFYDSFKRQSLTLVPIFLSGLILIYINLYTLANSDISDKDKQNISYAELFFSLIASSGVLYNVFMFLMLIIAIFSLKNFKTILGFILCILLLIISSPFVLTIIKVSLQNKDYNKYLSIATVFTSICTMIFTFILAFGGH